MPVPSPRNSVRIARGNIADLQANAGVFGDGEIIYSIDEDIFYSAANGTLFQVGRGIVTGESVNALADVDTSTVPPGVGQVLKWDGANWVPADDTNTDAVTSVAGKTGDVTLVKSDITDFSDADYATAVQGALADSAVQPSDNISTLTNDAGYITAAQVPADAVQSVNGQTGVVVLNASDVGAATTTQGALADSAVQPNDNISTLTNDAGYITDAGVTQIVAGTNVTISPVGGTGAVTINAAGAVDSVNGQTGVVVLDADDISDASTTNKFTTSADISKLAGIQAGAEVNAVDSVAGKTGTVTLVKGDVGLDQVDNTSDINKPISTATQSALDLKADLVGGVVPNSQLPSLAITEYLGTVASEAALLALTGQRGDWAIRTDTGSTWVITIDGGSTITDWTELATPADAVSSVNGFTGTVVLGASDIGAATAAQGALADSATQPGDNVSTLTNDAGYITAAQVPADAVSSVNGQTGAVALDADDISDAATTNKFATQAELDKLAGIEAGAQVNTVDSVAGKTGDVTLVKADVTDFSDADYATAAQGALADGAVQSAGDAMTGALGMPVGSESSPSLYFDASTGLYSPGANQLAISTNGTGRLFIDNVGRVGLGNASSPVDDLHILSVNPAIVLEESDAGTDEKYWRTRVDNSAYICEGLTDAFGSPSFWLRVFRATNSEQIDNIQFATSGNERLRIASDGKLGLGTSSPDELLHIEGDTAEFKGTNTNPIEVTAGTEQVFKFGIEGQKSNVYGPAGSIIFRQDSNTWSTTNQYVKPTRIEFCTQDSSTSDESETPRLVIDKDGNVGIGTTSPAEALEVAGNAILDASNAKLNIKAGGAGNTGSLNYTFNTDNTVYGGLDLSYDNRITDGLRLFSESYPITIDFNAGSFFRVKNPNNEYLRIDSSGRLLVGTSSAFTRFNGGNIAPFMQIAGANNNTSSSGFIRTDNSAAGSAIIFAKSRSTSYAIVQENDELGRLDFQGADGTDLTVGARIAALVDGTPGADDIPGRLVFSVTADSASSPTEALRISSDRSIAVSDGGDVVLGTTTGTKIGTATSQKIGFYNTTPVVQPTTGVAEAAFVENSGGTAVNVDSTFGGYTIQQVVEALQTLGLLALAP